MFRPTAIMMNTSITTPVATSGHTPNTGIRINALPAFRRPLAEEALGAEDEDQDEDREHDRLRPVGPRHVPRQALVPRLDQADQRRAEDGAGEVPGAAEHRGRERDQAELEAL